MRTSYRLLASNEMQSDLYDVIVRALLRGERLDSTRLDSRGCKNMLYTRACTSGRQATLS